MSSTVGFLGTLATNPPLTRFQETMVSYVKFAPWVEPGAGQIYQRIRIEVRLIFSFDHSWSSRLSSRLTQINRRWFEIIDPLS
jgi:hypothetical protein